MSPQDLTFVVLGITVLTTLGFGFLGIFIINKLFKLVK